MAKYDPLFEHLCHAGDESITMTFEQIGALVGGLPASAEKFREWWSNEAPGGQHVQARAWLNAGRQVELVDFGRSSVRFSAARWNRGS